MKKHTPYVARVHYTPEQQQDFILQDLHADIAHAEKQAMEGPFFPGITSDSLLAYADKCKQQVAAILARTNSLSTVNAFIAGRI